MSAGRSVLRAITAGHKRPLELWGGIECTVNRTDDIYRDQIRASGHHDRLGDLDLFAGLGISALRCPVLWERTMPLPDRPPDWTWPDAQLERLRTLDIRPVVGLVHHGSGPRHTSLLDEGFAAGLGRYAAQVAARFPWVEDWTPVNEPLTTARFSALYGHWYPHARCERSFWLALLNQVDGTRAAMRAIRRVNPAARLIQTDDLGRTYATAPLTAQADFDNARRWAGWDLLFGRVRSGHPLWAHLDRLGFAERLWRIADDPCPPDVIGVNHYLTSDRFLDHKVERYPGHLRGSNGRETYADTEAIRVLDPPPQGLAGALREAWDRYATSISLTEVHNGSTREEQLRWAAEAWDTAQAARTAGIDVRAVTAWSLLGSHGWNTLLTGDGVYEPGVFDVASGTPRPTALAALWRSLARQGDRHPVASEPGWWRRPERLLYGSPGDVAPASKQVASAVLIAGEAGHLREAFTRACEARGIRHIVASASELACYSLYGAEGSPNSPHPWAVIDVTGKRGDDPVDGTSAAAARRRIVIRRSVSCGPVLTIEACGDRPDQDAMGAGRTALAPPAPTIEQVVQGTSLDMMVGRALDLLIDEVPLTRRAPMPKTSVRPIAPADLEQIAL